MRWRLDFCETDDGKFSVTTDPVPMPKQPKSVAGHMAIYKDENEFFKLLMAADLPVEDTRRAIVAALHSVARSSSLQRTVDVDLTEKQLRVLNFRS